MPTRCPSAIRSGVQPSDGAGPLVELSQGTGKRPLFVIHPVGGTVSSYLQLARELDGVFQVYGLEAPGLRADMVLLDAKLSVLGTFLGGAWQGEPGVLGT